MGIKDELRDELQDAMRKHDRNRIDVVRQIHTEVTRAVTAPGFLGDADDELYRKTIAAYAKKMAKAVTEYESYGERGAESAAKLRFEVEYLQRWLPTAPSPDQIPAIVDATLAELGTSDLKAMGRVIGHVMKQHPGIDGTEVSRLVRERLAKSS